MTLADAIAPATGMNPGFVDQKEPIHHASAFSYDAPTTCGRVEQPKPAALEWHYVTCRRCLALAPEIVHARRDSDVAALCGAAPGQGGSTRRSQEVTCALCRTEIDRRSPR